MLKPTGAGKFEVLINPPGLLLYNFDIDGDDLKIAHKTFLTLKALPILRAGGSATVIGLTDRTGTDAHNQALSDRRVARTIEFLRKETPAQLTVMPGRGFGEAKAESEGMADGTKSERFRAVVVLLKSAAAPGTQTKTI